jgi:hypothetical protein
MGHDASLIELRHSVDEVLADQPSGAFVRLGSRSPKDTPLGVATGCRASDGSEALRLLTAGSKRVAFDLSRSLRHSYRPWVFLRTWQQIDWFAEFRCFLLILCYVSNSRGERGRFAKR